MAIRGEACRCQTENRPPVRFSVGLWFQGFELLVQGVVDFLEPGNALALVVSAHEGNSAEQQEADRKNKLPVIVTRGPLA